MLSSSRGQGNFRGPKGSRPRPKPRTWGFEAKAKDFKICPRGRPRGQGRPRGLHLWRIEGVTLFNLVRSSEIKKPLNIEPLILRIEISQPKWFGHVTRMPEEKLLKQALLAKANGRRPFGRSPKQNDKCNGRPWIGRLNLELLPSQLLRKVSNEKEEQEEGVSVFPYRVP